MALRDHNNEKKGFIIALKLPVNEISQQTVKAPESSRKKTENLQSAQWIKKNIPESNYSSDKSLGASLRGPAAQQPINKQTQITEKEMLTTASIFPRSLSLFACSTPPTTEVRYLSDKRYLCHHDGSASVQHHSFWLTEVPPTRSASIQTPVLRNHGKIWTGLMRTSEVLVLSPVYHATCPSDESQASRDTTSFWGQHRVTLVTVDKWF